MDRKPSAGEKIGVFYFKRAYMLIGALGIIGIIIGIVLVYLMQWERTRVSDLLGGIIVGQVVIALSYLPLYLWLCERGLVSPEM